MTPARPFGYLRYNPDEVGDPGALLAPPYDVVDEGQRAALVARSPYQSMFLELPEGGDNTAAARLLQQWIEDDVLELGEVGVAFIRQRYVGPDGVRRTRSGVVCEVPLSEFGEGTVLPHEQTFEAPRRQRLELMKATGANISPVFLVYHDPTRSLDDLFASVTDDAPDFTSIDDDGTQTAVWFVTDVSVLEQFEGAVEPYPLLIADGHHRYTAALAFREQARANGPLLRVAGGVDTALPPHTDSSGPDGVLAVVANSADPGMLVFPTHRVLHGVDANDLEEFVVGSGALRETTFEDARSAYEALLSLPVPGFVAVQPDAVRLLAAHDPGDLEIANPGRSQDYRSLDVVALHSLVVDGGAVLADKADRISYTRSFDEAVELVQREPRTIAFLVRGADVETVHAVAAHGELLPQKSTYFYPKVPTGVLFRLLEHPA